MRCHYEVLGVARDASDDDLKKAYRKLALLWHPDKHSTTPETYAEAETRFKEIQAAYEVLREPNERKWYDDHRESILRGKSFGADADDDDEECDINLWEYFSTSCFKGEEDFVRVYDDLFSRICEMEDRAYKPRFTDADRLPEFYDMWSSFVSNRSFAWADKYNVNEAPNRDYRRAMEKENKKERDKKRKEFQDRLRQLVNFVKKMDKRYVQKLAEKQKREAERAEQERAKREEEKVKRERAKKEFRMSDDVAEQYEEAEKMGEALDEYFEALGVKDKRRNEYYYDDEDDEDEYYDEDEEEDADESVAASSKQSQPQPVAAQTVNPAAAAVVDEDEDYEGSGKKQTVFCEACRKKFLTEKEYENHCKTKKHQQALAKKQGPSKPATAASAPQQKQQAVPQVDKEKSSGKNKKQQKGKAGKQDVEEEDEIEVDGSEEEKITKASGKEKTSKQKKKSVQPIIPDDSEEEEEIIRLPLPADSDSDEPAASSQEASKRDKRKEKKSKKADKPEELKCNVCGETFTSRNKLFGHIEETGHALHVGGSSSGKSKRK
jgi:DnaJ family protein A protein 5